jgi:hypothetical protein
MKIVEMFSQTIVSNDPAVFDERVNKFLIDTMNMFKENYLPEKTDISISREPVIFYQEGDSNRPLQGMNFIVEIYENSEDDDDDFYDYGGEPL